MTAALRISNSTPVSVQVIEACGEWMVRIVEDRDIVTTTSFEMESFALSYAKGQCIRLNIPEFERI
jgi:hypothetical protein